MTEQQTLVQFLEARLNEDAAAATEAGGDEWTSDVNVWMVVDSKGDPVAYDEGKPTEEQADHIARHGPARVLREVAAKRALLDIHNARDSWGHCMGCGTDSEGSLYMAIDDCPVLRHLAAIYSDHPDHPDYRDE